MIVVPFPTSLSKVIPEEKLKKQLSRNMHFLRMLQKEHVHIYAFVASSQEIISIDAMGNLYLASPDELLCKLCDLSQCEDIDLDRVFHPQNTLVSPLNATERFLNREYLLTENQEEIKNKIVNYIENATQAGFVSLQGGPGTGKTLLVYDIARDISWLRKILVVHSGILCEGHQTLNDRLTNVEVISAKQLRGKASCDADVIIIDEAHRLYGSTFDKVVGWVRQKNIVCLFSCDAGQRLSRSERRSHVTEDIDALCAGNVYRLTNRIRTNKELALFITCLRDLSKFRDGYSFKNVILFYEPDKVKAVEKALEIEKQGYTYISYTCSQYNHGLDYQKSDNNTHTVLGQEFDGVCMILDENWHYAEGILKGGSHPNPDYLFDQLLYQGLTRVRSKLALVVCSSEILKNILPMVQGS